MCVCVCVVCVCVVHVCVLCLLRLWNCGSIDATVEIKKRDRVAVLEMEPGVAARAVICEYFCNFDLFK